MPAHMQQRPYVVSVTHNQKMRDEVFQQTGQVLEACVEVCVNHRCGALLEAMKALSPLREVVK